MDHQGIAAVRLRGEGVTVHDGYIFVVRRTTNTTRYFKCKFARHLGCPASIKLLAGDVISVLNPRHNHARDPQDQCEIEFRNEVMTACISERGRLKTIYDRIALRNPEGARNVPYNSIRCSMARRRRTTTPNIPGNLTQLVDIFESGSVTADGQSAVIFGNPHFIRNFENSQFTFIDGTFKAVPRQPRFAQILTVFATSMDHAFPVIHVFMDRRTRTLYDSVFQYLHRTFPPVFNGTIVTDYEVTLVESLRVTFPEASLHGCFFHYCQAVMRKAKALGVVRQIEEAHPIQGRILLKKYYCLALLPPEIIPAAFESLEVLELGAAFGELQAYIRRQWIERVTPNHFSVFRQRHRTNNVMESYHRRLNTKLVRHPNIWELMDVIIDIQNIASIELEQLERQRPVFRIAKKNVTFNLRLNEAWDKLADGRFNFAEFLRQAVHFVDGLDRQLHQWNEDIVDQEEEPILAMLPMVDHQAGNLAPADNLPFQPPLPPLPIQPPPLIFFHHVPNPPSPPHQDLEPLPLAPIEPPPLIYFHDVPNPPSPPHQDLEPIPPPQSPPHQDLELTPPPQSPNFSPIRSPLRLLDEDDAPISPEHFPIYNFPPIPENVGRAFARFGDEDDPVIEEAVIRWEPTIPVTEFDGEHMAELLRCNVCYLNKVQYVMRCGHLFCTPCTARLFNAQNAVCGICRALLVRSPIPFYHN